MAHEKVIVFSFPSNFFIHSERFFKNYICFFSLLDKTWKKNKEITYSINIYFSKSESNFEFIFIIKLNLKEEIPTK